jgi:hypothetical protein
VSWQRLNSYIESVACLREARGTVLERNACREPWSNRLDFRVAQTSPRWCNQNFQLTLDVLNFGNLLNRELGSLPVRDQPERQQPAAGEQPRERCG